MKTERRHDMGVGGQCVCHVCEEKTANRRGVTCQGERYPSCGAKMLREGSHHHKLILKQKGYNEAPT